MTIRTFATLTLAAALAAPAYAQTSTPRTQTTPASRGPARPAVPAAPAAPPAPPAPPGEPAPPPPPPAPPRRVGQPVNVKIDVTITDQGQSDGPAIKKTVSILTADGTTGRIRSVAVFNTAMPLNVDADPEILDSGKIRLRLNVQYDLPASASRPAQAAGGAQLLQTGIMENLSLVLENGKSIVASQSADPVGDRQVTIEVKATVVK